MSNKTTGNDTIHNLTELCEHFGAWQPSDLNRQLFKNTDCGASISIYTGLPGTRVRQTWECRLWRTVIGTFARWYAQVRKAGAGGDFLDLAQAPKDLQDFFFWKPGTPTEINPEEIEIPWEELVRDDRTSHIRWTHVEHNPGTNALFTDTPPERTGDCHYGAVDLDVREGYVEGKAYHNGDNWRPLDRTPNSARGFTIQTIVEGSEVTYDSDLFTFPVTISEIDAWMEEMEANASRTWESANGDWFLLKGPKGEYLTTVANIQGDVRIEDEEALDVPAPILRRVRKILDTASYYRESPCCHTLTLRKQIPIRSKHHGTYHLEHFEPEETF